MKNNSHTAYTTQYAICCVPEDGERISQQYQFNKNDNNNVSSNKIKLPDEYYT